MHGGGTQLQPAGQGQTRRRAAACRTRTAVWHEARAEDVLGVPRVVADPQAPPVHIPNSQLVVIRAACQKGTCMAHARCMQHSRALGESHY